MKHLKRQEYKKFVEEHILRPFQGAISDSDRALNFNVQFYNSIPQMVEDNGDWASWVFERISKIFDSIDADYFPSGPTSMCILSGMQHHGVKVNW